MWKREKGKHIKRGKLVREGEWKEVWKKRLGSNVDIGGRGKKAR